MALERRSALKKVPAADVVDALTSGTQAEHQPEPDQATAPVERPTITASRPGPGRPRGKRRMEPFSTKIEITLRDELDAYLTEHEMTIIDFLDQAIRDRLSK